MIRSNNVLQKFNLKNKKLLIEASLDDYAIMYFRGGKFFISSSFQIAYCINIYTFKDLEETNKLNKNNSVKFHKNIHQYLRINKFITDLLFYSLNENILCAYVKYDNNFQLYKFKYS